MRDHMMDTGRAADLMPLETRGLTFEIAGKRLLDDLTFTFNEAGRTVIMGPNGAGKSLLLRLLHGLLLPTAGTMHWAGKPLSRDIRKRQAMVFQRPTLLRRSVSANIEFVLGLRGRVDRNQRDALLETVGLQDQARQAARLLSGGEQQRLALARALATNPDILFLDEPTANLDPASTLMIENIVQDAYAAGVKIIFVTHDIAQARRLADEVVFLNRGRLAEVTPAAGFFASPASPDAAAYLAGRIDF